MKRGSTIAAVLLILALFTACTAAEAPAPADTAASRPAQQNGNESAQAAESTESTESADSSKSAAVKAAAAEAAVAQQKAAQLMEMSTRLPQQVQMSAQMQQLGWQFHSAAFHQKPKDVLHVNSTTSIGGTITSGNQTSTTISGMEDLVVSYGRARSETNIGGIYGRDSVNGQRVSSTRLFYARPQLEYSLTDALYAFLGSGYEQHREAGIRHQGTAESGLGYYFYETDYTVVKGELGYRFDREIKVNPLPNETINAIDTGVELTKTLTGVFMFDIEVMSLFDVEDNENYRCFANASLTAAVNSHLAVGLTFGARYDNEPVQGFKRTDTFQTFGISLNY